MRSIRDTSELDDDDYDDGGWGDSGAYARRRRRGLTPLGAVLIFVALLAGLLVIGLNTVSARERDDTFCLGCHLAPQDTYHARAQQALSGAFATDLSSLHYQQIRAQGGQVRCITCHTADGSWRGALDKHWMTARHAALWLGGQNDVRIEKTALTTTQLSGLTITVPAGTLGARTPALSNGACIGCHQQTLLQVGVPNHMHSTLPQAYALWKAGARISAPRDLPPAEAQALLTRGLTAYESSVNCSDCHQTHRVVEAARYLDRSFYEPTCIKCHTEVRKGPVVLPTPGPAPAR